MSLGTRLVATTIELALLTTALAAQTTSQTASPAGQTPGPEEPTRAKHAMVVTIQHNATDAGVEVLKQGGNAIDAAVAVGFALAVVYPFAGNLGGGGFMLIRDHHGKTHFLDYREKAPAAATRDMYLDAKGDVIPRMSLVGYKASGVPGSVAGLTYAQKHFGKLSLAQDMAPAIRLATEGFVLSDAEARMLQSKNMTLFPASARIFQRDGNFYKEGDTFKQPELAATLTRIAKTPTTSTKERWPIRSPTSKKPVAASSPRKTLPLTRSKIVSQLKANTTATTSSLPHPILRRHRLSRNPQHPLHLQPSPARPDRSAAQVHIITEAFRRAYMDRGDYLGDPDFNTLPLKQMANLKYAAAWRSSIDPAKPTPSKDLVRPAGFMPPPPQSTPVKEPTQTTHFSIVDAEGNRRLQHLHPQRRLRLRSHRRRPRLPHEQRDGRLHLQDRRPNMFGLIQSSANSIAPGKRPLSAMTPTILTTPAHWYKHGKLAFVMGTPGGSTIITTVANDIISTIDNGLNIQQGRRCPALHHQYLPDRIDLEKKFPVPPAEALAAMGYTINRLAVADEHNPGVWGDSELIAIDPKTHELLGGHDDRRTFGKAAGY